MNNINTKVCLTVITEGSILSRQEQTELIKFSGGKGFDGKPTKSGHRKHHPLVQAKKATQRLNISEDAYRSFISDECPHGCSKGEWKRMSKKKRLEFQLGLISSSFNGLSFEYEVFND